MGGLFSAKDMFVQNKCKQGFVKKLKQMYIHTNKSTYSTTKMQTYQFNIDSTNLYNKPITVNIELTIYPNRNSNKHNEWGFAVNVIDTDCKLFRCDGDVNRNKFPQNLLDFDTCNNIELTYQPICTSTLADRDATLTFHNYNWSIKLRRNFRTIDPELLTPYVKDIIQKGIESYNHPNDNNFIFK